MSQPITLCFCYASQDEKDLLNLRNQLSVLEQSDLIRIWYVGLIAAGSNYAQEKQAHLDQAQILVLLISKDFLDASHQEIVYAVNRHTQNKVYIIPIILRPCLWDSTPLGQLQALPRQKETISHYSNKDEAWAEIAREIRDLATKMQVHIPSIPRKTRNKSGGLQDAVAISQLRAPARRKKRSAEQRETPEEFSNQITPNPTRKPSIRSGVRKHASEATLEPVTDEAKFATEQFQKSQDKLTGKLSSIQFNILVWEPVQPAESPVARKRREIARYLSAEQHQCWPPADFQNTLGIALLNIEMDIARKADFIFWLIDPEVPDELGELREFYKYENEFRKSLIYFPQKLNSGFLKDASNLFRNIETYQDADISNCTVRTSIVQWVSWWRVYRYQKLAAGEEGLR